MDKAKIAKLCNEIEDIACDISQQTMNDIVSAESRMIFDKAKEIAAEISEPPKSNGDRIRQMTDEELCDFLDGFLCYEIGYCRAEEVECRDCKMKWLKQEAKDDAESKTD